MNNDLKERYTSRKFLFSLAYIILTIINSRFGWLTPEELETIFMIVAIYIGVEGGVDLVKATKLIK